MDKYNIKMDVYVCICVTIFARFCIQFNQFIKYILNSSNEHIYLLTITMNIG